jgi:hypothetical protein
MATDSKIQFRDTATSIGSTAANTLQVVAPNFGLTGSFHISSSVEGDANPILKVDHENTSNILFVTGSGKVGVGTPDPTHMLHVSSSVAGADTDLFIIHGFNSSDPAFEVKDVSGLNYVGINTPAGTYPLSVNLGGGNARFTNGNILFSQNNLGLRIGTIGSANSTFQSITAISSSVKTDSGILIQAGKSGADEGHGVIVSGSSESRTFRIKSHATDNIMFADGDGLVMFNSGTNSPAATSPDEQEYADINFFVSGSVGSKGSGGSSAVKGTALFGGDLVVSGTLHGGSPLKIGSIPKYAVESIDLGGGAVTSATITPTTPVIFLDADAIGQSGGFFTITLATSGYTDGETVKFVVTTDVNENIIFDTSILSDAAKAFGIASTALAQTKGASFELIYVASASKWAVLNSNGLASF